MSSAQQQTVAADAGADGPRLAGTTGGTARRPGRTAQPLGEEAGFSTAELLGNAALGITALVAVWALLRTLGVNVVQWIGSQIGVGMG